MDYSINLYIDSVDAFVNGVEKTLDVCASIINGRTMIPVRFVSEELGFTVGWKEDYTVTIDSPEPEKPVEPEIVLPENEYTLENITLDLSEGGVMITLEGVGEIKPDVMSLNAPYRTVFDFKDCTFNAQKRIEGDGVITAVRAAQFENNITRVVIDTPELVEYRLLKEENNLIIQMGDYDSPISFTELAESYKSDVKLSKKASNKLVILDAGHGGSEVGTIGNYYGEEIFEKDINLKITLLVNKMLKNNGVKTYMIRDDDSYVGITQRPVIANEEKGYMYLSIHNNASENEDINGVQIYYSESTPAFEDVKNEDISKIFYNNIASLGLKKAGVVDNPRYIVIYKSQMPAFIIENAFVSNKNDLDLLMDDEFIYKLAEKICDSAIQALNMSVGD
jgi:N-acetylmuramoyl-L-alanine amidase